MAADVTRLKSILLNTGLQIKDNPLYQLLNGLIDGLSDVNKGVSSFTSVSIPGPPGPAGAPGFLFEDQIGDADSVIAAPSTSSGGGSSSSFVPYLIPAGSTFVVPINYQALFEMTIEVDGILEVDGFLIEVH